MNIDQLIEKLETIRKAHPNAEVIAVAGEDVREIELVDYDYQRKKVFLEV